MTSDAVRIANLESSLSDVSAYLDELRKALAEHDSALGSIRLAELEQRVSPSLSGPGVPTRQVGSDAVANTLGNTQPYISSANLLADPAMERIASAATTLTSANATLARSLNVNPSWRGRRSDTSVTCTASYGQVRGLPSRFNSGAVRLRMQPTGAGTHEAIVESSVTSLYLTPYSVIPYLVGAIRAIVPSAPTLTGVTSARVVMGLVAEKDGTVAASVERDVLALVKTLPARLWAAFLSSDYVPTKGEDWRLRITFEVVASATGGDLFLDVGEPQMHLAPTPDPYAYVPVLGGWQPESVCALSHSNVATRVVQSGLVTDAYARYIIRADGKTQWGDGTVDGGDLRLYRSGAKTLTIDDAAAGAATLKVIGTRLAPPSSTQTLVAATALLANAELVMVTCSGSVTSTAAPTIADGLDGQVLTILNVGTGTWTITDQGTLASSNLRLTATTIAIGPRASVKLIYSATVGDWVQVGALVSVI